MSLMTHAKIREVVLIEPKSKHHHSFIGARLPRLGLPLLGKMLEANGYRVKVLVESLDPLDWDTIFAADLVGISSLTATAPETYETADRCREKGIITVLGGVHVTFCADEAMEHSDFVVRGEGEDTLMELMEALESGKGFERIDGLSFRDSGGRVVHNPDRPLEKDLDKYPIPDLTLSPGHETMTRSPVVTTRGCPFTCTFCSVITVFGRRMRLRSVDTVVEELKSLDKKNVFFYDDNFTTTVRHTKSLLRRIKEENIRLVWSSQVRADITRNNEELLSLMRDTGCEIVYIGFESISEATLASYEKKLDLEQIKKGIKVFHSYGIKIHGMFVVGADEDTPQVIRDTAQFSLDYGLDSMQVMIITPLPGTPFFKEMDQQGRIILRDWGLYNGHNVVYTPKGMSAWRLKYETIKATSHFYSSRIAERRGSGRLVRYFLFIRFFVMLFRRFKTVSSLASYYWARLRHPARRGQEEAVA